MPLRNGTARRREHVGPVAQLGASGVAAENALANGVGAADSIPIDDGQLQTDFLLGWRR